MNTIRYDLAVRALRIGGYLAFWCPYCEDIHRHRSKPAQVVPARCWSDESPWRETGYALVYCEDAKSEEALWPRPAHLPPFKAWLSTQHIRNNRIGDFIGDALRDKRLPDDFVNAFDLRNHLFGARACEQAIVSAMFVWRRYVGRERVPIRPKLRFAILRRDGFMCRTCGGSARTGATLHVDHFVPVARGGTNDESNLWTLCFDCNMGKGVEELN